MLLTVSGYWKVAEKSLTHHLPADHYYLQMLSPTPLVPIRFDDGPKIWCKLDFLNPSGSTKDRIARFIVEKAWRERRIGPDTTVVRRLPDPPASPLRWHAHKWACDSSP
ncbi:MAG: pyridoxal-phosphate dependent enzyme [Ignavibacteriota bacterium]